jgi:PKD repeat protein
MNKLGFIVGVFFTLALAVAPTLASGPDLSNDGIVDNTDLNIIKASFGKRSGETGFNPLADTNNDGVVDLHDLFFIARRFGDSVQVLLRAIADCAPTSGSIPLTVRFISRGEFSGGSIVLYRWDFEGDGNFNTSDSVARDIDFTFKQAGTYNSVLEVTNNLNETATGTCTIVALGNNPTATVNAVPSNGSAPLLVNFSCIGTDTDGTIALYEWDFEGDGVFDFNSPTAGNTTHTYTTPGSFNALCRVTDNNGMTGTASTINSVIRPGPPGSPTVVATATHTEGKAPFAVTFGGNATDDGNLVRWEWDFDGDGTFDFSSPNSPNTNFTYNSPGTFAAVLRVTDNAGLTSMDNIEMVVGVDVALSIANETFNPTRGETVAIDTSTSANMPVRLLIKDKNDGRVVRTLVNEVRTAGNYSDPWDGHDDAGQMLPQGAYYAILEYNDVGGKTFDLDLTNTTGGSRSNPQRSAIPNNFSPLAGQPLTIDFTLAQASEVTAFIGRYDVDTRLITFMERVPLGKGTHQVIWNGENADGQLIHPPSGDSFLFGIWSYTLANNAIYLHSGAHISNFSVAPSIFDPTGHIDDQGTPEQSRLTFDLSNPANVELVVSNAETGKKVAQRQFTGLAAGTNTISWDGRDDNGLVVASGRYRLGVVAIDSTGFRSLRLYALQRVYY